MLGRAYQYIWFPSNLLDRTANILLLFIVMALFIIGFDYAKVPMLELGALRSLPAVQLLGAILLMSLGVVVAWGLAREEYVTNTRALLPAVSSYIPLAAICSIAWLIRGLFSKSPYILEASRSIDWNVVLEIVLSGQLLAVINIGTLYFKKGDGSAVRAFANSHARVQKLLSQLLKTDTPAKAREELIPSLQVELKAIGGKSNTLDASLHCEEAALANTICKAAGSLEKAIANSLHAQTARNPRTVLATHTKDLDAFGVK